jgi:hypothetical protein
VGVVAETCRIETSRKKEYYAIWEVVVTGDSTESRIALVVRLEIVKARLRMLGRLLSGLRRLSSQCEAVAGRD